MNNVPEGQPPTDSLDISTGRFFNETAIRDFALGCSAKYRAGKFTRVGSDFVDEVKTDVECMIREIRAKYPTLHPALPTDGVTFTTGALLDKLQPVLNAAIARCIQNKVQRQPTVGKTLGRTR